MGKVMGISFLFIGIIGYLYQWIQKQKIQQKRLEIFMVFLQKTIFAMETENIKIIPYFLQYQSEDEVISETLKEIAYRLQKNIYPKGQSAWEEVFGEKKQSWGLDHETYAIMVGVGNGFFGRNREENICFLQKSLKELEIQNRKIKEKNAKERTVWIPVGMLSGVMIVILFL